MIKKRSINDVALGFFLLTHPLPVSLYLLIVALGSIGASWPHLIWTTIILVITAHAAMQFSISMLNDYCDRRLDAMSKPGKPIVRGLVLPREALIVGILMIGIMLILLLLLNPLALLFSLGYLILGQAYNFGLKSTPFSGIILALMFSLIPPYVFAGVGRMAPIAFWLIPVAFIMGLALNLANSLPDIEGDAAGGAKTLAVFLGLKWSFLLCQLLIALSAFLIALLTITQLVPAHLWVIIPLLVLTGLSVTIMSLFFGPQKPVHTRTLYFQLAAFTCVFLVGGWFLGALI
jgi:4-hydroxybenzoate polyprenyltransferase